jgi:predicted Zn-dependent protease
MVHFGLIALLVLGAESPGFTLRGHITADKPASRIELLLEELNVKQKAVLTIQAEADGSYQFNSLPGSTYRLTATIDGSRKDRRDIEIVCRPGSIVSKDFHYGKTPSTLTLHFPSEDPDFVDVAELAGDYPKEVLRDYERAFEDQLNGRISKAVQRLEGVAQRAPNFYGVHSRLGLIFQQSGCYADAQDEYRRASEISPRSVQPLLNLASAQILASDNGKNRASVMEAVETLNKALSIRPDSALAYCLMGAANAAAEQYPDAERSFQRALELDQEFGAAHLMLANVYLHQEMWDGAIQHLESYLSSNPGASDSVFVKDMLAGVKLKKSSPKSQGQ